MANSYDFKPTLAGDIAFCQAKDCKSITLTFDLDNFLNIEVFRLMFSALELEIYDVNDELISTVNLLEAMTTAGTGTIETSADNGAIIGTSTEFTSELVSGDYVIVNDEYFFKVDTVSDDNNAAFTTAGDDLSGATFTILNNILTLYGSDFGETEIDSIPDGLYTFVLKATVNYVYYPERVETEITEEELTLEFKQLLYCNIKCCVEKKIADMIDKVDDCCLEMKDIMSAMLAWSWLESLKFQVNCQYDDKLENTFNKLREYCLGSSPCNCS